MIKLNVKHTVITASNLGTLVKGNVNSFFIHFIFSSEWTNLIRTAVFSCGDICVGVPLSSDTCAIPWEALAVPGKLFLALRGSDADDNIVLCTENVFLGKVSESLASEIASEAHDPTPSIIDTLRTDVETLKAGSAGGHTPVKGVDYFTDADKAELAAAVAEEIDLGDYVPKVFGNLDGHQGNLAGSNYIAIADAPDGEAKKVSLSALKNSIATMLSASDIAVYQVTPEDPDNVQDKLTELQTALGIKQNEITASGLLKGNGNGGVSAAVAGTDYVVPSALSAKVNIALGVAHAGEFLVVGSDGNVTTQALAVWQGGSY